MSSLHYRSEIDGLRALSVLLIIFYHLQMFTFSGGFVGVDVFFVISGFLITRIIIADLEKGSFSFKQFYVRRVARIVPALLVTVILSLLGATFLLMPKALVHTAWQSLYALFSVSNIFFLLDSSYWGALSEDFLLLHTWSLGVEEQFYLVYPVFLFLLFSVYKRTGVLLGLLVVLIGGAIANVLVLRSDPAAAFYFAPLRFYEFALGGLGSMLSIRSIRFYSSVALSSLVSLLGLSLILYSAVTFSFFTTFPGTNALIPSVGALLVILAGDSAAATRLLANPIMRWLGKISYSLYLVHWPITVLYRYCLGSALQTSDRIFLLVSSLLLAALLNKGIEQRFRLSPGDEKTRAGMSTKSMLWMLGMAIMLVSGLALVLVAMRGMPQRFPDSMQALVSQDAASSARDKRLFMEIHCKPDGQVFCGTRRANSENIMLLADSLGLDMYIAIRSAYPDANVYVSYAMGCAPVFDPNIGKSKHFSDCPRFNRQRLKAALEAPSGDIIFLAMDFNGWRGDYVLDTAKRLIASGKRVFVLGESRFLRGKTPQEIAVDQSRFSLNSDYINRFLVPRPFALDDVYEAKFKAIGATYISARDFFYQGKYRLYTNRGDALLSYDGKHLSEPGAKEFGRYLAQRYPFGVE